MTTDKKCKYCAILFKQLLTKQLKVRKDTLKDVLKSLDRINDYCYETNYLVLEYFRKWLEKEVQK